MARSWLPSLSILAVILLLPIAGSPASPPPCQSCGNGGGGCGNVGGDGFNPVDGGAGGDGCSPIIIDVSGHGFHLTSTQTGVQFDIMGTGKQIQIAWTVLGSDNAFLTLPDADGRVINGKQLFGNLTPQPPSANPNGFLALAVYDRLENGGNGDGLIDAKDKVFALLRLWIDANHDGIAQPTELYKLPDLGVHSIGLSYQESRRIDEFGNEFRYRGDINIGDRGKATSPVDRKIYDVFLTTGSSR